MHHKMGKVISKAHALFLGFADQCFARQRDVPEDTNDWPKRLDLGEAQHIGGAVLAAPLLVKLLLLLVIGQKDRQLGCALHLCLGLLERFQYGALGQRIEILGPVVIIADNSDFKRQSGQRVVPSVAFSANFLAVSAS